MSRGIRVVMMVSLLAAMPALSRAGDKGQTSASFLKLSVGARAVAMGEAQTADVRDATAVYWNPALLAALKRPSLVFMHAMYFETTAFDHLAYVQPLGTSAVGLAVESFRTNGLVQRDTAGSEIGGFSPGDTAVSVAYAHPVLGWPVGADLKVVQSKITDTAQTLAADFGVASPPYLNGRLRFGAAVTNLGQGLKYDAVADPLPRAVRLGAALGFIKNGLVAVDVVRPNDADDYVAAGLEYGWSLGENWTMALRGGYTSRWKDAKGASGLSAGMGIGFSRLSVDYAFVPAGELGDAHRISVGWAF